LSDPRSISPTAVPPSTGTPQVRSAIARAAQATGVDFAYLLGEARLESSLDPAAKAGTSSASGLYQFTGSTWLQMLDRHGAEHGMGWAGDAISGGKVTDPALRGTIMGLRFDPDAAALMAGELANDNRMALTGALGREPDAGELYLAHFLGADGASRFLSALVADPAQSAATMFPAAASANRAIFYDGAGAPRSLGGVMDLMHGKMAAAMQGVVSGQDLGEWAAAAPPAGFALMTTGAPQDAPRPSMAETLAATFGSGPDSMVPPHVRAAYGKLQAFGL